MRMEPPVSLPMDALPSPTATATPEPLDEPPDCRAGSCGLHTSPVQGFSPVAPNAISCMLVLAKTSAPAACSRCTTALDAGGIGGNTASVPAFMGAPSSWNKSFTLIQAPSSGRCAARSGSRPIQSVSACASRPARPQSTQASGLSAAVSSALAFRRASSSVSERFPARNASACCRSDMLAAPEFSEARAPEKCRSDTI